MKTLEILKNRRALASIFGVVAIALSTTRAGDVLDVEGLVDAVVTIVEAISAILAIVLPIISLKYPKK